MLRWLILIPWFAFLFVVFAGLWVVALILGESEPRSPEPWE